MKINAKNVIYVSFDLEMFNKHKNILNHYGEQYYDSAVVDLDKVKKDLNNDPEDESLISLYSDICEALIKEYDCIPDNVWIDLEY